MEHRAKILVVDDEEELRTVIVFGLDSYLGELSFEEAKDGQEAMEKFRAGNTYDLVISDYRMPNATGHDLFKFLEQNHPDQPFILCSSEVDCFNEFEGKKNVVGIVEKPDIIDPLVNLVKQQLQSDGKTTDYCRISLTSLLQGHNLKSDVFIRLSDEKYVRVAPEGQTFTKDDFRHYKKKGISDLYVKREHAELYLNNLMSNIKSLHHVKNLSVETSFQFSSDALSTIHDIQSRLGFNEELEKLTQEGFPWLQKPLFQMKT